MPSKKTSKQLNENLSEALRREINASGLAMRKIQDETGIDRSVLSRFMSGNRSISIETADKICKLLGLRLTKE